MPRQSGEGVEPLRLRWVRLQLPPPPSARGRRGIPAASAGTCGHHPSRSSRPLVCPCSRTEMLIFGTLPGACLFGCFRSWMVPQGGAWAQCPWGGPVPCKCSSCAGQSLRTTVGGGGRAGDRAPVCRCLETGHSCQERQQASGAACLHHPWSLSSHWGQPALSSHPGARSGAGEPLSTGPRPGLHLFSGVCPSRPTGIPHELQEPTLEALPRGSRQLGSWAVPPTRPPRLCVHAPWPLQSQLPPAPEQGVSSWVFTAPRTPEPPHPQEQTGLGEPPGPGPSWSLPHRSCKGGLPLVPTEAASPSPPRPTLGTGLCAGEAAGEGQAAACQPVAATLSGLSSHGNPGPQGQSPHTSETPPGGEGAGWPLSSTARR